MQRVYGHAPPVRQQRQQIEDADGAVAVEARRAAGVGVPPTPVGQQGQQVEDGNGAYSTARAGLSRRDAQCRDPRHDLRERQRVERLTAA